MTRTIVLSVNVEHGQYVSLMACLKCSDAYARAYVVDGNASAAMLKSLIETQVPSLPVIVRIFDPEQQAQDPKQEATP